MAQRQLPHHSDFQNPETLASYLLTVVVLGFGLYLGFAQLLKMGGSSYADTLAVVPTLLSLGLLSFIILRHTRHQENRE